jgi:hypothetical protein
MLTLTSIQNSTEFQYTADQWSGELLSVEKVPAHRIALMAREESMDSVEAQVALPEADSVSSVHLRICIPAQ